MPNVPLLCTRAHILHEVNQEMIEQLVYMLWPCSRAVSSKSIKYNKPEGQTMENTIVRLIVCNS